MMPRGQAAGGSAIACLPGVAADGLAQASKPGGRLPPPPRQGGLVFAAWAAALAAAGTVMTVRGDIA